MGTSEVNNQSAAEVERQGRVLEVELQEAGARIPGVVNQVRTSEEDVVLSGDDFEEKSEQFRPGCRILGQDTGRFEVPEDFDDPLPDALLDAFGS